MEAWQVTLPKESNDLGNGAAYSLLCDGAHDHTKECIWVWHDCGLILGPNSVAPGSRFGWRPSGILAHDLVSFEPLTISPSVYWPECCGKHGFVTDGVYSDV